MIRCLILTLTILALIFMAANQNPPVKSSRVDYCQVGSSFQKCAGLKYTLHI